jgi:bilirubin oxidase
VAHRILARPPRGTVQLWKLVNNGGGWAHPIHVHLVDFHVIHREKGENRGVLPYEAASLQDVVLLGTNEVVYIEAHFIPWDGLYMFHCHNLVHEDHAMMAAFNVTELKGFNYPPQTTEFVDPLDERFRAKPYDANVQTLGFVQTNILPVFAALHAYDNIDGLETALGQFLATATGVKDTSAPTPVNGGGGGGGSGGSGSKGGP